jgi:hypothetical protein
MGVTAEIAQHLQGTTEGLLGIDDPVEAVQAAEEFGKLLRIGESGCRTGAAKDSVGGPIDGDLVKVRPQEWRSVCGDAEAGSVPKCAGC